MHRTLALAALAGIASCGLAQDITFELLQTEDISVLSSETTPFFIGSNPVDIAYDGNALYVCGFNNTPSTQSIIIAQIFDFLAGDGVRSFAEVGGSLRNAPAFNTYSGLDWHPQYGLLSSYNDFGGGTGQFRTHNTQTASTLVLTGQSSGGRGRATPSWDAGFDGAGYALANGTGPLASVLDNDSTAASGYGIASIGQAGPIGLDSSDASLPGLAAAFASPPPGVIQYPRLIPSDGDATGTLWRALDIKGPLVTARAENDLLIAQRDANNQNVGEPIRVDNGSFPFEAGHDVVILDGQACGDTVIVWNSRPSGCSGTLPDSMLVSAADGSPLSYEIVDANGDPVVFETGNCFYGFDWYADEQLLFVSDFVNRLVYVMTPSCGGGGCTDADLAEPFGVLDLADINAFVGGFISQDPIADLADPAGIFDLADINAFVASFLGGCP